MKVDLHVHTTASDGSWAPRQLVAQAQAAGIACLAVTDHDTIAHVEIMEDLAQAAGMAFIKGVEICTTLKGQSFHILGYGIDTANKNLRHLLDYNTRLMEETDHDSMVKLIDCGYPIDLREYEAYRHDPARGGWKSLSFLIDKGLCKNAGDFFAHLFTAERGITFPEFPLPSQAIAAIRDAGGIPVLAHPGSAFHGHELEETLNVFGREEIAGIECYHPSHEAETIRDAIAWCRRHSKLITGGSDCHGEFIPERKLGYPAVTIDQLQLGEIWPAAATTIGR